MPSAAPPRDAPPAVATSAASVTPHRVALALLLRLLAGPPHSAEPGLADELRARAAPPSPPPRCVRQRLALFLLRETRLPPPQPPPSLHHCRQWHCCSSPLLAPFSLPAPF
ncbi:unnamed protein product, partial [Closterium sp. Naga37s-1]